MNSDRADPESLKALRAAFDGVACAPPLGWSAVRTFEAEHRVVLPEPYRSFVAEVADGAPAGPPYYGLVPLADVPMGTADQEAGDLARPFPLTEAWLWEEDSRPVEEIEPVVSAVATHGSVNLGTDGCGMDWHLIVTGPHRGQIWFITGEGAIPFGAPFGYTTATPGFAGWVDHWAVGKDWFDADNG